MPLAAQHMLKNIALFIDGTWNAAGDRHDTNVRKLFDACFAMSPAGDPQVSLYIPGVGRRPVMDIRGIDITDAQRQRFDRLIAHEARWRFSPSRAFKGGAFGWGMVARIKLLYLFLSTFYSHQEGDKIFIFGFSRGAFIARSLTGFFSEVGLLIEDHLDQVEQAYAVYMGQQVRDADEFRTHVRQLPGVVRKDAMPPREGDAARVQFHFLGVWDTVAALGLPWWGADTLARETGYHQVDVPPNVIITKHALAIHELRQRFEPLLFSPGPHGHLEQRWFPGAHADVGGGYTLGHSGLSDAALRWMAGQASEAGLAWSRQAEWAQEAPRKPRPVHHQIRRLFLLAKPTPRAWLRPTGDRLGHTFDASAIEHLKNATVNYAFWRPGINQALKTTDELAVASLAECLLLNAGGTLPKDTAPWSRELKSMKLGQFGHQLEALLSLTAVPDASVDELAREASLIFLLDHDQAEALLTQAYHDLNAMVGALRKGRGDLAKAEAAWQPAERLRAVLQEVERLLGDAAWTGLTACMRVVNLSVKDFTGALASAVMQAGLRRRPKPPRLPKWGKPPKI